MTTIATDGVTIAGDGLIHSDGQFIIKDHQKIRVGDGPEAVVYALCGTACMFEPAIKWIEAGADPEKAPKIENEWQIVVIKLDSIVVYTGKCPYPEAQHYPFTMGTGREYALAALKLGKSPREAVELAMECDLYTDGEIQVVKLPWMPDIAVPNGAFEYQSPYDQPERQRLA